MKKNPFTLILQVLKRRDVVVLQIISLLVVVVGNSLALITPQLGARIIDDFFAGDQNLGKWFWLVIIILVGSVIFGFLQSYVSTVLSEKIAFYLREKLIAKYLSQQYSFIIKIKPSKIMTVIGSDVNSLKQLIGQFINGVLTAIILLVGSVILMFSINARLSIYIVLIVPTILFVVATIFSKASELFKKGQIIRDSMNRIIDENIKGSMLVRVFVSENTEKDKFHKTNSDATTNGTAIIKIFSLLIPIMQSTNLLGMLLVLLIGGQSVIEGNMTLGGLSAFNNYVVMFTMPILILSFLSSAIGQALASLGRINELLSAESTFENGIARISTFEELVAKDVTLKIDDQIILEQFNFRIKKGERIGVIGLNGAGKSMLLNLLSRQLDTSEGEILLNGKNIKDYDIAGVRQLVGFAFQENFLLDASIYQNIDFGRDLPAEQILRAAEIADVDELSSKFDEGMQHQVGERGTTLSGGQKQRIMIARALAENPSLLFLDDVTSMLDVVTEQRIIGNIKKQYPDIAIVIVSQKIVSIRDCDRIYVIEQGKNEVTGTHEKLIVESKLYEEIELTQRNYTH